MGHEGAVVGRAWDRPVRRVDEVLRRPRLLRVLIVASIVVNIGIVVTGGAVRLTKSGLGCPTWPRCTGSSLLPTAQQAEHGVIEFSNRTLTFVVSIVAIATLLVALRQLRAADGGGRRRAALATAIFLGIPAQAVLGGFTVLTDLNPWLVAGHFLLSMVLIALTVVLLDVAPPRRQITRTEPAPGTAVSAPLRVIAVTLGWLICAATAAVLVLGTITTGTGPHAGATNAEGVARRIGLDPQQITQAHADAVMVLVGLTVALLAVLMVAMRLGGPQQAGGTNGVQLVRSTWLLLALEVTQGLIGFVQYFTGVPPVLVGLHMLGACLIWATAIWILLLARRAAAELPGQHRDRVDQHAHAGTDDRAVDPDELEVTPDLQLEAPAGAGSVPALHRR